MLAPWTTTSRACRSRSRNTTRLANPEPGPEHDDDPRRIDRAVHPERRGTALVRKTDPTRTRAREANWRVSASSAPCSSSDRTTRCRHARRQQVVAGARGASRQRCGRGDAKTPAKAQAQAKQSEAAAGKTSPAQLLAEVNAAEREVARPLDARAEFLVTTLPRKGDRR